MLDVCKQTAKEITNNRGNIPRVGVVPRFSDLEVIALSLTAELLSIDSENFLFSELNTDYIADFPHLISRRQYNDCRKYLFVLTESIRKSMVEAIDKDEDIF